jgi:hypothetical protein
VARLFAVVRPAYSGDRALATVAFVEQRWRWPGNRGFDESIDHVAEQLRAAGYVEEKAATPGDRLTFRIEQRSMSNPAWEPLDASLTIVGTDTPVLRFATNRNMLAVNSSSRRRTASRRKSCRWAKRQRRVRSRAARRQGRLR